MVLDFGGLGGWEDHGISECGSLYFRLFISPSFFLASISIGHLVHRFLVQRAPYFILVVASFSYSHCFSLGSLSESRPEIVFLSSRLRHPSPYHNLYKNPQKFSCVLETP